MREVSIRTGVRIDVDREGIWRGRHFDALPARTFRILNYLAEHANMVIPYAALLVVGWPNEPRVEQDLYRHIHRIRQSIEINPMHPSWLITRKDRGYMLLISSPVSMTRNYGKRKTKAVSR